MVIRGINGLQGPLYFGVGYFHHRKALYGVLPDKNQYNNKDVREFSKKYKK